MVNNMGLFWLFIEFFKIGLFTFGGGYAMIPLLEETVKNHSWLTQEQFINLIGICESTPGPIAINMATYIGSSQEGIFGAIVATIGVVLPSFIIILLIAAILKNFTENKYVKWAFTGINAVVIGLICSSGIILLLNSIGYKSNIQFSLNYLSLIILSLLLISDIMMSKLTKKKTNAITIIILSAVFGIIISLI